MSEQWIIAGVTMVSNAKALGDGNPPLIAAHEHDVNEAIEGLNANADGIGVVIRVDGPVVQTVDIDGVICTSATTTISFGVPASVYATLTGARAKYLPEDFDEPQPEPQKSPPFRAI